MARRPAIFLFSLLVASIWLQVPFEGRIGAQEPLIVLEHKSVFGELQRPAVNFFHMRHAELYKDCTACHHIYEYKNGARINTYAGQPQNCSECHRKDPAGKKVPLMEAFHENCTGCHRDLNKSTAQELPATCGECHTKPEKAKAPHFIPAEGPQGCADCHIQAGAK